MFGEPKFETEQALCAAFTEHCRKEGLTVYAETAGFDLLVVYPDGRQLGIEAKLKLNEKVLSQILPNEWTAWSLRKGPTHRAILVPRDNGRTAYLDLLAYVGLDVITAYRQHEFDRIARTYTWQCEFGLPKKMHDWNPAMLCKLPEYVPDVVGGAPAPLKLTEWKIAALKIMADLELDGFVSRENFRRHGIDYRRWTTPDGWLAPRGKGEWVKRSADFDKQHPAIYAQILEKAKADRRGNSAQVAPKVAQYEIAESALSCVGGV